MLGADFFNEPGMDRCLQVTHVESALFNNIGKNP
jgi:hypothetical protein